MKKLSEGFLAMNGTKKDFEEKNAANDKREAFAESSGNTGRRDERPPREREPRGGGGGSGGGGGGGGEARPKKAKTKQTEAAAQPAAKKAKTEMEEFVELCNICGAMNHLAAGCYRYGHVNAGNKHKPYSKSQAAREYLLLDPPSKTLSDTHNSKGEVMDIEVRQAIADKRTEVMGATAFVCDNSVLSWKETQAKKAARKKEAKKESKAAKKQGSSAVVYCAPCYENTKPTAIISPATPAELCECVTVATQVSVKKNFTNQVCVSCSPCSGGGGYKKKKRGGD